MADQYASRVSAKRLPLRWLAALAGVLLVCRLAYMSHPWPVHPDENEFVAAIGFPTLYPVHHPGYPLWVALGTLLRRLGLSPYVAYQSWTVAASIVGPLLVYVLLRSRTSGKLAWWTALALGVCPIVWFAGETALNYSAASTASVAVVLLCVRALDRRRVSLLVLAAGVTAAGALLRPDVLVWLALVLVFTAWRLRTGAALVAVVLALLLGGAATFASMEWLYERAPAGARGPRAAHTWDTIFHTSVIHLGLVDGLVRNVVKIGVNVIWNLWPLLIAMFGVGVVRGRAASQTTRSHDGLDRILWLWIAPPVVFLSVVHMSEPTHVSMFLPPVFMAFALFLDRRCSREVAVRIARAATLFLIAQFLFYPWSARSSGAKRLVDAKIGFVSGEGLQHIDRRSEIHMPGDFWPTAAHQETTND